MGEARDPDPVPPFRTGGGGEKGRASAFVKTPIIGREA